MSSKPYPARRTDRPDRQFVLSGYKTSATPHRNICENYSFAPNSSLQFPYVLRVPLRQADWEFRHHAPHRVRGRLYVFLCYLTIGIPLAVLPGFVHTDLGYGLDHGGRGDQRAVLRNADVAAARRPHRRHGRSEEDGALGLAACAASGVLLLFSALAAQWHALSLVLLIVARLVLGFGKSWGGTVAITWGIGRMGVSHNAKVISWNGIATRRRWRSARRSVWPRSFDRLRVARGDRDCARRSRLLAGDAHGKRAHCYMASGCHIAACFSASCPTGRGWRSDRQASVRSRRSSRCSLCGAQLVERGAVADGVRHDVHRRPPAVRQTFGGFRVAIVSFACECVGLLFLWPAADPHFALAGAALRGFGFALGVSGAGRRGGRTRAAGEPGRGVVGLFRVSGFVAGPDRAASRGMSAGEFGYGSIYLVAAAAVALSIALYVRTERGVSGPATA